MATLYLDQLKKANRIFYLGHPHNGWISTEYKSLYKDPSHPDNARKIIIKYLEWRGPVSLDQITRETHTSEHLAAKILETLRTQNTVVNGKLIRHKDEMLWCDKTNFAELYRTAIALRRKTSKAIDPELCTFCQS